MERSTRSRTSTTQRAIPTAMAFGLVDADTAFGCDLLLWDDDAVIKLLTAPPQTSATGLPRHVDAA